METLERIKNLVNNGNHVYYNVENNIYSIGNFEAMCEKTMFKGLGDTGYNYSVFRKKSKLEITNAKEIFKYLKEIHDFIQDDVIQTKKYSKEIYLTQAEIDALDYFSKIEVPLPDIEGLEYLKGFTVNIKLDVDENCRQTKVLRLVSPDGTWEYEIYCGSYGYGFPRKN